MNIVYHFIYIIVYVYAHMLIMADNIFHLRQQVLNISLLFLQQPSFAIIYFVCALE